MPPPQPGIIPEPSAHARFMIVRGGDRGKSARLVAKFLGGVPALVAKVAALDRRARLVCTVGIGPELWGSLSPTKRPKKLRQFAAIARAGSTAPSTGGDLLFHILSKRPDLNFELARRLTLALGNGFTMMDDVAGFRYLDSRDLTGFIDGTENPKGKACGAAALIGAEDPEFAGGSYGFTQRYVHDLKKWAASP